MLFKDKSTQNKYKRRNLFDRLGSTLRLTLSNKLALIGLIITITYYIIALLDTIYPEYLGVSNMSSLTVFLPNYHGNLPSVLPTPPRFTSNIFYIFGTTQYGIPLFPAILASLKVDLGYSTIVVLVGAAVGVAIGSLAGYFGGFFDDALMRATDIFLGLPQLVFAIAITTILGRTLQNIVIALMIIWWPVYARLSRSQTLALKSSPFILAATAAGSSGIRNIYYHIIPNIFSPIFIQISLDIGSIVLLFAGLDFIGLNEGNPLLPELGKLIVIGESYLPVGIWWPIFIPGIFLLIFTVSVNMLGDGLRDSLDPKLRR